jgi:hypothetical protein
MHAGNNAIALKGFERALEAPLSGLLDHFGMPGVVVALRSTQGEAACSVGLSTARGSTPASDEHRVPISCVMKIMVALVVLHGHESGVLDIDDDVARFLPELQGHADGCTGITLRHLLTHTAGYIEPQANSARWGLTWERFVEFFPTRKQAFRPGTIWSYTHTGYAILQHAVESAYGRSIDALLGELVIDPLGFRLELHSEASAVPSRLMSLHVRAPRTGSFEPMRPPLETGFLRYSISDYVLSARQIAALGYFLSGSQGSPLRHLEAARARLLSPAIKLPEFCLGPEGEAMPLVFCHGVADYGGFKGVNGSYVGSTCALRFDERSQVAASAVVNAWVPAARDIAIGWALRPFKRTHDEVTAVASPTFEDLGCLEGEYEGLMLGSGNTAISREGESLLCRIGRRGAPDLGGRLARKPDGTFALVGGSKEVTLAVARDSQTGLPYLMTGTSACRKVAA